MEKITFRRKEEGCSRQNFELGRMKWAREKRKEEEGRE